MKNVLLLMVLCGAVHAAVVDVKTTFAGHTMVCDGSTDDTAALQYNLTNSANGDTLVFPSNATCIMGTQTQTPSGNWYNVQFHGARTLIGSGTTIKNTATNHGGGVTNAVFGIGGIGGGFYDHAPLTPCQTFYPLNATTDGDTIVTLTNVADGANFNVNDLFMVYETNPNPAGNPCVGGVSVNCPDVCPAAVVATVSAKSCASAPCTLTLSGTDKVQRSFATPFICNATSSYNTNVFISGLTIIGNSPIVGSELYNASFIGNSLISNVAAAPDIFNMSSCTHCTFIGNLLDNNTSSYSFQESVQRNSFFGLWQNNTINATNFGQGEFGAAMTYSGNVVNCHPATGQTACFEPTIRNSTIKNNVINSGGNWILSGNVTVVFDDNDISGHEKYYGKNTWTGNTINCMADGKTCVELATNSNSFTNNVIAIATAGGCVVATPITDFGVGNVTTPNSYGVVVSH